ncbi:histidine phosphatase family protein [Caenispirillum bisanense]|uniref:Histidine phosphatase superfamily (Branch 1) n=1 Tax=Caenispirillum bisanense TaxID=414052 RepID=A0A286H1U3_9PROT|nr:histidine phosphatase family protein [Caenispirillum bisanense]SOE01727.1 Histidine phosphatase superfamily (branch 1) [Caenispirillum bisanense]
MPIRLLLAVLIVLLPTSVRAAEAEALWQSLRDGGRVVILRHALAPGTGDPPNFRLDDCSTQRNLDDRGRAQARALGDAFRDHAVPVARVLTSRWCRAAETADLMALAPPEPEPLLNSFFGDRASGPAQIAGLRRLLDGLPRDGDTVVMVTHQVVITGLTDVFPASGEGVVLRLLPGGGTAVEGRLPPPQP